MSHTEIPSYPAAKQTKLYKGRVKHATRYIVFFFFLKYEFFGTLYSCLTLIYMIMINRQYFPVSLVTTGTRDKTTPEDLHRI